MLITLLFTIEKAWEKQSAPTGRIDSENIHTGILVSLYKEGNSVIRNNMGETGWYCAKRNKQNRERQTVHDLNRQRSCRLVAAWGWAAGEMGRCWSKGINCQLKEEYVLGIQCTA